MQIYLARNNQQAGPYSLEQLNQMLASQQVLLTDLIWYKGLPEWKALGELTQGKFVFQPEGLVPSNHPTTPDIQNQPPNSSYQNPTYQHSNTQQVSTQNTSKAELASIGSRIFAKIIDMLLWLPSLILLMSFFSAQETLQIEKLNQQAMTNLLSSNPDPVFIGQLQDQFFQMLPQQAIISFGVYLLIMLGIQAYLIAKSGQSIGKKLMKIQIVNADDQQQSSLLRAFTIRSVFFILLYQFAFPLLTIVDCLFAFGKNRQTLHDKLAKTIVIKKQS